MTFCCTMWAQESDNTVKIAGEVYTKTLENCYDRYKIYPTSNMYNFLKLDTKTGQVYRIQWAIEDNKRYETNVSNKYLVAYDDAQVNGRFELYATENIYNFILLDKFSGKAWQIQWGFEIENNVIVPISSY